MFFLSENGFVFQHPFAKSFKRKEETENKWKKDK